MVGCAGKTCFGLSHIMVFPYIHFLLYVRGQGVSLHMLYGTSQQQGNMHI